MLGGYYASWPISVSSKMKQSEETAAIIIGDSQVSYS
jgi:hypothetical protein